MSRQIWLIGLVSLLFALSACKKQNGHSESKSEGQSQTTEAESLQPVRGEYTVDTENSTVSFTSIKNSSIPVGGYFTELRGDIEIPEEKLGDLEGEISVDLTTVDTGNSPRDDAIRTHFFETETEDDKEGDDSETVEPFATFSIDKLEDIDQTTLKQRDKAIAFDATGALEFHETEKTQTFSLKLTRTGKERLRVETVRPFGFSIEQFGMGKQLKKLMEVCGHKSVSDAVPVHISLALQKK